MTSLITDSAMELDTRAYCTTTQDGRTIRSVFSDRNFMFKYYIDETREFFISTHNAPLKAYDRYLSWVNTYTAPDGFTIHRLIFHETDKSPPPHSHHYIIKETDVMFSSNHMNIFEAYREWEEKQPDSDDSNASV